MSGTFDTSVVQTEELGSNWITYEQRSLSQKRYSVQQPGHNWSWTITTIPMIRADWQPFFSWANQQRGRSKTFSYTPVSMASPLGSLAGSTYLPVVNGSTHAAGGNTVDVTGLPPSVVAWKAGDFLKFDNHSKAYAVESTSVSSSTSGTGTVTITPDLVAALTTGEAISFQNVVFTMAFSDDVPRLPVDVAGFAEFNFTLREAY